MSPMAYNPFSAVSMYSPTCTNPRSILAFDFSNPQPSVIGLRPTASSSFSACSVCDLPSLSLNATATPFASFLADSTLQPVKIWMPFFWKALLSSAEISSSSSGTTRGNASRMVTCVPNEL